MTKLSIVIPCFNEKDTLRACVERVLTIADEKLGLEVIVVDDCSTDGSQEIAKTIAQDYPVVRVILHERNRGKGAALRTGIGHATGHFVAIQDADLEYDPHDLKRLIRPLREGRADVVLGSRFASMEEHRVLYFWHSLGNKFLTFLSNMFTDLNLTDMETCYKVFRREVIQKIDIRENRFGFEPEIVAKISHQGYRIYEMGISYHGRTYEEGKKIGFRDGFRALYCIVKYNAPHMPVPLQFMLYLFIGGAAALVNLLVFLTLLKSGFGTQIAIPAAFVIAALTNYFLCILLIFRHNARWKTTAELLIFVLLVTGVGFFDYHITQLFLKTAMSPVKAKLIATALGLIINYVGRRYLVFPERSSRRVEE
ncbi:bifunctional glycosyltransferase family 2/GtrA family protein [bacterium]|nr:bifunctional glycosyltransferase family 2/GtrA family protein [bacterium]